MEITFSIKICIIRFLKDSMISISSDLHEEILKSNKSHTNRIIKIIPCKTALRPSLFGFRISSYKTEEIELILSFKDCIIQILM